MFLRHLRKSIFSLYGIKRLAFIAEKEYVYMVVRPESLNEIHVNFLLSSVSYC